MAEWPQALDRGVAGAPLAGEERSGDKAVFVPTATGALAGLIDGLGHGPEAADAAELCAGIVRQLAEASAQELLQACHQALVETRGVVMTLAWFDLERSLLTWAGVGNVDARLVHQGPERREDVALVFGGVLGYRLPNVRPATMALERGDLLVMITDGIESAISPALAGGGAAQTLADRIFDQHGKGTDDALTVVVRYR
ncbi:SpoIIE family protein phosphatase [Solirubrobacter sp. CPCC 204708]|uniref:SpoIIE family protein phosphatase n=1 Tax=Solirubrobacter deserti TaxID=2282478 RepID=A0ABT4RIH7_9ACTN|nr:SpoIIE family protein phosphatase [Solirubrobacter deserti]MBE2320297.1 SpoIIE family protein phosphatase [Solirubrobacter deserti]MDA0138317.1 SpoIIE family protein phosphatase [Solirubrobacter deserti]